MTSRDKLKVPLSFMWKCCSVAIKIRQRFFHCTILNPGPFDIEAAREKALVKSGHVTPQILDIA